MTKIVLIGAGSANFGLGTIGDIFKSKILEGSDITLHDINPEALEKFLLEEGRQDKLNKNLEMIRLHDLTNDVDGILHYPK